MLRIGIIEITIRIRVQHLKIKSQSGWCQIRNPQSGYKILKCLRLFYYSDFTRRQSLKSNDLLKSKKKVNIQRRCCESESELWNVNCGSRFVTWKIAIRIRIAFYVTRLLEQNRWRDCCAGYCSTVPQPSPTLRTYRQDTTLVNEYSFVGKFLKRS